VKIALLGDIHGNHLALQAVLDAARQHKAERLLVTGDLVGYYFWPREVLELLAGWEASVVSGNHEVMLGEARRNDEFGVQVEGRYGCGVRLALEQLDPGQVDGLCALPHTVDLAVDGCRILLCHGSPWDVNQYVYPDAPPELLKRCAIREYDLVVSGHTHYPMSLKIGPTALVNPGSVGQPRNRQPGAHWAIFDTESREATLLREAYDAGPVVAQSRRRHPDITYLSEVLERT